MVAACSPRMHEPTFRKALEAAGLNPYMLEMANIREQCSWVHDDPAAATDKACDLTHAAIRRVRYHQPLEKMEAPYTPATAGARRRHRRTDRGRGAGRRRPAGVAGGDARRSSAATWAGPTSTAPYLDSARDILAEKIARAEASPKIKLMLRSELTELSGFVGNFIATVRHDREEREIPVGSVVVCTGYQEFDATRVERLGYGRHRDVITSFELEKRLREGRVLETDDGRTPALRVHRPLRGLAPRQVPPLLLARLLHDRAEVRPRDQVGHPRGHGHRPLRRHAQLRQGRRGLLPPHLRAEDHVPDVREGGLPQGARRRARRRLRPAGAGSGEALG